MHPRRCYACNKPVLGCIMGGTCPECGASDTPHGRWWYRGPRVEQPHFLDLGVQLPTDPEQAAKRLEGMRRRALAALGPKDMDQALLLTPAEDLAGKRVRLVVAMEVLDDA